MITLDQVDSPVNDDFELLPLGPEDGPEDLGDFELLPLGPDDDDDRPDDTRETSEWIDDQADRYRALGSDLADLVAETIAELARTWRVVSQGSPISVETFKARCEVLGEFRELASIPEDF